MPKKEVNIIATYGQFVVVRETWGDILTTQETVDNYINDDEIILIGRIGDCRVVGGYTERFDSIEKWLKDIQKREQKRLNKIEEQLAELKEIL